MKSIQRISITDEVVKRIKTELVSGIYQQGDKLATEKELSEELQVGRSTLREALRMLQALGFIEIRQGKGAFVLKTVEDSDAKIKSWFSEHEFVLHDLFEIRLSIEPLAVKLAVQRATDEEIRKIGEILLTFEEAVTGGNVIDIAALDEAFHSAIMEASHNKLLSVITGKMDEAYKEYRLRSFAVKSNVRNALEPHRRIFECLKSRNMEAGMQEMIRHLEISLADIRTVVAEAAPDGGKNA